MKGDAHMKIENTGVFLGKLGPIQTGHEVVIQTMFKMFGPEKSLIIIGSSNSNISLRHFFSYQERRHFIKTIFPEAKIIGLPDYLNNEEWLIALDDLLKETSFNPSTTTFFSGCEEDIVFLSQAKKKYHIVNRFDGTSVNISSTEVRDCLIHNRSLEGFINPIIETELRGLFNQKWEEFKKV